jgi:c-di-GMP-related signal transduction protein
MEVFVARQPIFTREKEIIAYELLYRNSQKNSFSDINGDVATTDVIINSFLNIGMNELSDGKPCFINFTENLLQSGVPAFFKPDEIVVEILESVEIGIELVNICKELKSKKFQIALDDFIFNKNNKHFFSLINYIDIIKVDFRNTTEEMRRVIERVSLKYNIKLLAEKVETLKEFESAVDKGYVYFQGYFFSKPVIVSTQEVPEYLQNHFQINQLLSKDEPDLNEITWLIEQDLSLSYKLLKLVNSPAFRGVNKINSIKQAVVRIGLKELKKWLYLLSIRGNVNEYSEWTREILHKSLTRAKMCEALAKRKYHQNESSTYFLTGMFSLMDTLLGMDMDHILKLMPLAANICEALKGQTNQLKEILNLCISIEKGDWEDFDSWCERLKIEDDFALNQYNEAFKWTKSIMMV